MNDRTGVETRPRRAWPRIARVAAALAASAGIAQLAACGGSPESHVAQVGSTTTKSSTPSSAISAQQIGALAFSRCMRSNGVARWPDPDSGGGFPKRTLQQLGVASTRFQAAESACNHLLPNGGSGPDPAEVQQARAQALKFSQCMRDHRVTNFPDPISNGRIPDPTSVGINQGSPQFQAANQACREYRPAYMPSNAAYNSWVRSHGP